jgi:phage protein D/phage baseplate assembly protein gpV
VVRGYDKSHRLHRARKTRTFVQVTDADLAKKIAPEYGLTAQTPAGGPIHPHVYQDNQTDWEFLRARANHLGCELYVREQKLVMRVPSPAGAPPVHELGTTLLQLRLRMSAPMQVSEVMVKGWDPEKKQAIVGTASTPSGYTTPSIGLGKNGKQVASAFGGDAKYAVTAHNVGTQQEAKQLAQAVLDEVAGEFIQLEGTCVGDPKVRAGQQVQIKGVGQRYDGKYYVTATRHTLTPHEGYRTGFTVSGRQPVTLAALLGGGNGSAGAAAGNHRAYRGLGGSSGRHAGVVVGLVTNVKPSGNDAKYEGSVKVKFPWLADDQDSHWARLATPMAGAGRGFYFLPEVNDEVLVAFEHGDINRPYVVGALWNGKDQPPAKSANVVGSDGKVNQRILKTRSGHTITFDDSTDKPGITVVDKTGNNKIVIDSKNNKVTITSDGALEITAPKGDVAIKGKTLTMEATQGAASLKGKNVTVDATTGNLAAKGTNANLEASAKVTVKGNAGADIQTSAVMNIKGTMVNIN